MLGFGVAAGSAVCAMREDGYEGPITVVTDAGPEPYSPVLTSYYVGGRIGYDECFPWTDLAIGDMVDDLRAYSRIETLDVDAHEVVLSGGGRIGYSKLLVATGAHPIVHGFSTLRTCLPHVLRTMQDAGRLRCALEAKPCERVLVSGTSMVGLKVLEACLDRKIHATMLGRSAHILRVSAHPLIAERFENMLEERGVTLRLSQTVACVEEHEGKRGCTVHFSNGDADRFDEVVLAQGVKPNIAFVDPGTIEVGDGLVVDQFMRTSAPDVFAAGDVAQAIDLSSGRKRIIGLWSNAVQQGRCAGRAIAAELAGQVSTRPYPGSIPSNSIHVRDILFASAGSLAEGDGRRICIRETQSETGLFVYEEREGSERLVGFNVLAIAATERRHATLADEIGMHRRAILNSYL